MEMYELFVIIIFYFYHINLSCGSRNFVIVQLCFLRQIKNQSSE